ncbi:MAG: pyridoxamine 5'-phosphate oxidase family protein [Phycisphaerae bacterium]|nr:pyridoxamine 5'-phosphate oxidase family protein [Phycisphaerae bacterium]
MDLASYFEENDGVGILGTCDPDNGVDLALYAKPLVIDETTIALVMKQRLSHQNLKTNLQAAYLFLAKGTDYKGLRLYLTMLRQESNQSLIAAMRKKQPYTYPETDDSSKFLVFFRVDRIRPLVGDNPNIS